ncbi:MAG: hypothetical protein F4Y60_11255 [Boseongicola sp. SB0664_bin_43]|uniref:Uncharacterized protein n=1 Tax=Boseongicola sp. SB0664_bin_43 TaxID=2604844 RepID=A0A6B0Y3I7_9RHOB|nr:hypothetical protein [Boseongicola sp. SB0664_bin_43]
MPALTDPEAKRPLSRTKLIAELDRPFAWHASQPLESAWAAPVPGESDANSLAMPVSKEGGRPAARLPVAMPEISSWNLSAAIAPARVPAAETGQSGMAMGGAGFAACKAEANSRPAAAFANWRGVQ